MSSSGSTNLAGRSTRSVAPFSSLYSGCVTSVGTSSTRHRCRRRRRRRASQAPASNDLVVSSPPFRFLPLLSPASRIVAPTGPFSAVSRPWPLRQLASADPCRIEQMHHRRIRRDVDGLARPRCDPLAKRADDRRPAKRAITWVSEPVGSITRTIAAARPGQPRNARAGCRRPSASRRRVARPRRGNGSIKPSAAAERRRLRSALQKIHRRRTDEAGDKQVRRDGRTDPAARRSARRGRRA